MMNERKIRNHIRKILLEDEVTRRPGRGGYKKEIQQAGALAAKNPGELMSRLGISRVNDNTDIKKLNSLLSQAVTGSPAMAAVYLQPQPRKDKISGSEGIRIPVTVIPPRDARKYLEHTLVGAQASQMALFDQDIQIEILGNDVLIYFSSKPYSWGAKKKKQQQNQKPKPKPIPQATDQQDQVQEWVGYGYVKPMLPLLSLSAEKDDEVIGEPDFNPEEEEQEEASGAGAVAGVITPLGTGPKYPDDSPKRDSPAAVAGRSFGDAKPYKKPKKRKK